MKKLILFLLVLFSYSIAQNQFNLSGTVKNQADFRVIGLIVNLMEAGYTDTTDSSGAFEVIGDATSIASKYKKESSIPRFTGTQFIVPVTSSKQPVSVEMYNLKGSKITTVFNNVLPVGEHSIPLMSNRMNNISQSVLIAVVRCGSDMTKFRLVKAGNQGFMVHQFAGGVSDHSKILAAASHPLPVLDSLQFKRCLTVEGVEEEFIEFTIPIENLEDEFKVTLDLIPYEAIEWGMTQDGRSNETVGQELGKPGSGIYPYEFQTYYNGAWCSEFYSYCMRIGGCPLGNDEGSETRPNWLLLGWDRLITWFENNAEYVKRSEIDAQNYVPNPGDFIQMNEHTAMVRYIASDDDVVCLDGNWGDKVVLSKRGNYKT